MQELLSPCVAFNLILLKTCQSGVGNQNFRFGVTAEFRTKSSVFRSFGEIPENTVPQHTFFFGFISHITVICEMCVICSTLYVRPPQHITLNI